MQRVMLNIDPLPLAIGVDIGGDAPHLDPPAGDPEELNHGVAAIETVKAVTDNGHDSLAPV